ncbi:hypothetical protein H4582DRAFT_1991855 [Lactarius indigo]|nr:hypothetical protein H4582DRAFT_1991855 [Lactarius indigo]
MTHRIQTEQDLAALAIGHCFLALVVKKLAADIKLRPVFTVRVSEGELACMSAILRTDGRTVTSWLDQPRAIGLANIVSLMSGEVGSMDTDPLPSDVLDLLQQTLRILSEGLLAEENANPPLDQIQRFQEIYPKVTDRFKSELQRISETLPSIPSYTQSDL